MNRKVLLSLLENYFNILKKRGETKLKHSEDLLILSYIEELLYSDYFIYITEEDYEIISCYLENSIGRECYIPFSIYKSNPPLNNSKSIIILNSSNLRVTEDSKYRDSSSILRTIE